MNEYPLSRQIFETAKKHAERLQAARVTRIHLVAGESSGVEAESIRFYFNLVAKDSPCDGAELVITAGEGREFSVESVEVEGLANL